MIKLGARICLVDDDLTLLTLLQGNLARLGYECLALSDSGRVLEIARKTQPDLFLLDRIMPRVDGLTLCRMLKEDSALKTRPVIFLTAAEATGEKLEAFEAGAVDYITKPINMHELAARVATHVELFRTRRRLEEYSTSLEKLAEERAKQLVHADRLASIGTLSAGVAHEINNPATFISGNVQMFERFWPIILPAIEKAIADEDPDAERLRFVVNETPAMLSGMREGVQRIQKIVHDMKAFAHKGDSERRSVDLSECVDTSLELCRKMLKNVMRVVKKFSDSGIQVFGDKQQIEQVLVNLFVNACDAAVEARIPDPVLELEMWQDRNVAHIIVSDNGPGISEDALEKIWNPFFTTKQPGKGTGLGLFIAKSIITGHGGSIGASLRSSGGMKFHLVLPTGPVQAPAKTGEVNDLRG